MHFLAHTQVLPLSEEKKTQKLAAGDLSGVVQCFSVKKGEFAVAFKTLPNAQQKVRVCAVGGCMRGTRLRGDMRSMDGATCLHCRARMQLRSCAQVRTAYVPRLCTLACASSA